MEKTTDSYVNRLIELAEELQEAIKTAEKEDYLVKYHPKLMSRIYQILGYILVLKEIEK